MDQNPQPETAQPVRTEQDLARAVRSGFRTEPATETPGAKQRNVDNARAELGYIESLNQNPAFAWFFEVCIESHFREARTLLEAADAPPKQLGRLAASFITARKIVRWLDEREIQHRRLDNPNDPKLEKLRARLDLH